MNCRICTVVNCDCPCTVCRETARFFDRLKTERPDEKQDDFSDNQPETPINNIDENGVAHNYTDADDDIHGR
jgi:hypothetical protein